MAEGTCSVAGCDKTTYGRGWCVAHWTRWWRWGDPLGSAPRRTPEERFVVKCKALPNGCLLWVGAVSNNGYGRFGDGKSRVLQAHRWAYEHFVGPIPEGLTVEHLCHTRDHSCRGGFGCLHRRCVEPKHLTLLSNADNVLSGNAPSAMNARKTHCKHGHEFNAANTRLEAQASGRVHRRCRACERRRKQGP